MSTQTVTEPMLDEAPPCWPPLAHLVHKRDMPVREGTLALCGHKLMGIDLGVPKNGDPVCGECHDVMRDMLAKGLA